MAAPEAAVQDTVFRTAAPPSECEPRPFPPSSRKLAFETQAADPADCLAVGAEHLLNTNKEDCGPERQAPGAQADHPVTMPVMKASVVKKGYSVQPPSVRSSGSQPADMQTQATSKSLLPIKSKDVDVSRHLHPGDSETDVTKVTKPRRENGLTKATETAIRKNVRKGYKPLSKQKPEEELKDKNQLLEAVNKQLHEKLTETQEELKDLTQKVELLEKFQGNCLAILESKGLNPGNETLESQQESTTDHTDSMLLLETLKDELKTFNESAKKQMEELQALKVKLKLKEEERVRFLEQQTSCNDQVNDFSVILEEMEQLLEM